MEIVNYKKPIGWSLIIFFSALIINSLFSFALSFEGEFYKISVWWYPLSQIIKATALIFVAFNRKSQASIISKIGACLFSAVMLIYIISALTYRFTSEIYLYFPGSAYLYTFLYTSGLLLFVWGLSKLWLPVKLVTTLMVAIHNAMDIIGLVCYDLYCDLILPLNIINITVINAALILTIIWFNLKSKVQSAQEHNIDLM